MYSGLEEGNDASAFMEAHVEGSQSPLLAEQSQVSDEQGHGYSLNHRKGLLKACSTDPSPSTLASFRHLAPW